METVNKKDIIDLIDEWQIHLRMGMDRRDNLLAENKSVEAYEEDITLHHLDDCIEDLCNLVGIENTVPFHTPFSN